MKKMVILLMFAFATVSLFTGFGQSESLIPELPVGPEIPEKPPVVIHYDHYLTYCYFANTSSWWTGLAILNASGSSNIIMVTVYDTTGAQSGYSSTHTLDANELLVDTLENLITSGTVPNRGSIMVEGTEMFEVDKFTGNSSTGGFSEIEKSSEIIL
jgi:hypothetical protein